jgi:hypothetical protein
MSRKWNRDSMKLKALRLGAVREIKARALLGRSSTFGQHQFHSGTQEENAVEATVMRFISVHQLNT